MEPTLETGQGVLVNSLVYYRMDKPRLARYLPFIHAEPDDVDFLFQPPERGELIVFRYPEDPSRRFVKRIIGLPGDIIRISRGDVFVNDVQLDEPYVWKRSGASTGARVMGPDQFFVLGDNRKNSNDSRNWGPVPLDHIVGRVWVSYWPLSRMGFL